MPFFSNELLLYLTKIVVPALAILTFLFCVPRDIRLLRIFSVVLLFVLLRDSMSPTGLWTINSALALRFIDQPSTLWVLALSSFGIGLWSQSFIGSLGRWNYKPLLVSIAGGAIGGLLVALLPFLYGFWTSPVSIDAPKSLSLLVALAALSFFGNYLEEVIFRGHFQGYLNELKLSDSRVIFLSAGCFAICHSFLAFMVSSLGAAILLFTFYEGLICAFLRQRFGLLAAVLAHGTGIFLMASGVLG